MEQRKVSETEIADVLRTVGMYADGTTGAYRGYGSYRSIVSNHSAPTLEACIRTVKEHEPSTVVEIGTLRGGSLYGWSRCFESATQLLTIDITDRRRNRLFEHFDSHKQIDYIIGDSHDAATVERVDEMLEGPIDFLYIDGDHSYEAVKADFEAYKPSMADNGIIGFDDCSPAYPGVWDVWNEIKSHYRTERVGYVDEEFRPRRGENYSGLLFL